MKPPEIIKTERLILRKPRMDDAPAIFTNYAQDPEVTRYITWRPHKNLEDTYRVFATCDVGNLASARVMEKAGMLREGLLRRYGFHPGVSDEPRDSYIYAIVK